MDLLGNLCVWHFLVSGVGIVLLGLVPFRTCPLLVQKCLAVLSFSLDVWLWSTTSFSLFLSLSGAGETQTHFGFGFPLVSLHPGHDLPLQSVRLAPTPTSRFPHPLLCFFFSFRRRSSFAGMVVGWLRSGWSLFVCLCFSVCLSVSSVCLCVSCIACKK